MPTSFAALFALAASFTAAISAVSHGDLVRIDFDGRDERFITEGTVLNRQYQSLMGSPRFEAGATSPQTRPAIEQYLRANPRLYRAGIASNTDLRTTLDHAGGGVSAARDGYVLRSMPGFLSENGEPVITMLFERPMAFASVTFAGDSTGASAILLFRGGRLIAIDRPRATSTMIHDTARYFSLTPLKDDTLFDTLVIIPGSSSDYTAITQISWAAPTIPAPGAVGALGLGACLVLRRARR